MHINDLTDDCLLNIFHYFDVTERVGYESVCKRWRHILPLLFIDIQQIDVADFVARMYKTHCAKDSIQFTPAVVGLVSRCGPFLREINFGKRWLKVTQPVIDTIADRCGKLTILNLGCIVLQADIRPALKKLAPQLVVFSLDETHWILDRDSLGIGAIFPAMQSLKKLHLKRVPFELDTLDKLPATLETLNLGGARQLQLDTLQSFLLTHASLRELHLSNFQYLEQGILEIIGAMPSISTLEVSCINRDDLDLSPIAELKDTLQELYLQNNNSLVDNAFRLICIECTKLTVINLCSCKRLRDFGALAYCQNLTKILVSSTTQICDADLTDLASNGKLTSLTVAQCVNVSSTGLISVAQRCPLREICINQCTSVDDTALVGLVDNPRLIPIISIQKCRITNEGMAALGQLDNSVLKRIRELDISYNQSINDASILALYQAIRKSQNDQQFEYDEERPTIHVHQTNVSKKIEPLVGDHIKLVY